MNNAKSPPLVPVDVSLFGGLYTEANPADLPEGASPESINCDYIVGTVKQRPGKRSLFYYTDFFSEKLTGFAHSIAGIHDPDEVPWTNPTNATLNTPGSYAEAILNTALPTVNGVTTFDVSDGATATSATVSTPAVVPAETTEWAVFVVVTDGFPTVTPDVGWADLAVGEHVYEKTVIASVAGGAGLSASGNWAACIALFKLAGTSLPTRIQRSSSSGSYQNLTKTLPGVVAGNAILIVERAGTNFGTPSGQTVTVNGNAATEVASKIGALAESHIWFYPNAPSGTVTVQLTGTGFVGNAVFSAYEVQAGSFAPPTDQFSQVFETLNFPFSIPTTLNVFGFEVEVSGHQTDLSADAILTVSLIDPESGNPTFTGKLPSSDGTTVFATPTETWGLTLTPTIFNNPNFGVRIVASATGGNPVTFDIYAVKIKVFITPDPPPSINYIKTFSQTGGEVVTLALGSDGIMYREDAINAPGALMAVYTAIEPSTFGQSCTQSDREFIALSNLLNGTDIPYTYDGTNFDRLSQVGPGAKPSCSSSSSGSSILSITQNAPFAVPVADNNDNLVVSDSPSATGDFGTPATPGNVLSLAFHSGATLPSYITPGTNIVVAGFPTINGNVVNNDPTGVAAPAFYTVTSVGQSIPGQDGFIALTFTVRFTTFINLKDQGFPMPAGMTIQSTTSTMTTADQVPNLEVGSQFQVAGTGGAPPAGYDNAWLVTATPNAAQLLITSTSLVGNVATYAFSIITGSAPTVGQFVTVVQCLNGNGVFNVVNAVISSVTISTFSIAIINADVSSAAESAAGIIFGTIFEFDAFTIIPDVATGTVVTSGTIGAGHRKCCYSFLTRNGYITQPSPIVEFDVATGASAIAVANLATGPSNVIARIIHLTSADGGNFYNIPQPVTVNQNGLDVVNSSTWVNDNTTTNVVLSFSDGVLLAASPIDVQGNNLFETAELGSVVGLIPYAFRMFAIGEQDKVTNFLNWSFDGGIGVVQGTIGGVVNTNAKYPLGWTVDPTNGAGSDVIASPLFGFAYSILNSSGMTQATYGMITQPAFEDEFDVPIIVPSTTYSVRITAAVPTGPTTGNLVVDLYSPAIDRAVGTFTLPLASLQSTMLIFSGTMLTTVLAPVPGDLLLRLYATTLLDGVQITVDRVEIFPTEEPNLSLQVTGSYVNNFEAFDQLTGVISGTVQNQQPIKSAFTLFDSLYLVKSSSLISTQDNGTTEPSGWQTRTVSNAVGTPSIYGVTTGIDEPNSGEEWAIIAGQAGAFIFNGGQPIKLSEEIQSLWNQINWAYGHTLWVKNDIVNRRILFGVPLKTPNDWLPTGIIADDSNPTTPNVILALNYKQINTANELADRVGVHTSYAGRLIASDLTRKWSIWTVKAPCAAFVTRANTTTPLFLGNSDATGKIYDLVELQLDDDGVAIDQRYTTYGFVTPDQEQALQIGSVRKMYEYMTLLLDGAGSLQITVYPNTLDSPYSHDLLPNITLPGSVDGDTEVPVNETGSRLFMRFRTDAVGEGFQLSKMVVVLRQDPWSPVRGRN